MSRDIARIERSIDTLENNYINIMNELQKVVDEQKAELEKAKEIISAAALESVKSSLQGLLDDFKKQTITEASASIRSDIDAKLEVLKTSILQSINVKLTK